MNIETPNDVTQQRKDGHPYSAHCHRWFAENLFDAFIHPTLLAQEVAVLPELFILRSYREMHGLGRGYLPPLIVESLMTNLQLRGYHCRKNKDTALLVSCKPIEE